jgi:hypothetical protein
MKIKQIKEMFSKYINNQTDYEIEYMKKQITNLEIEIIKNKQAINILTQKQAVISSEVILNFDAARETTITINDFLRKFNTFKRCVLSASTWALFFITICLVTFAVAYYV